MAEAVGVAILIGFLAVDVLLIGGFLADTLMSIRKKTAKGAEKSSQQAKQRLKRMAKRLKRLMTSPQCAGKYDQYATLL